jgi:uncharacterized DUF497 family protein
VEFEWDPKKAADNLAKHGVSFHEATTVFDDVLSVTAPDPDHSVEENRFIIVGLSHRGRLLIVSHAERGDRIRLINARELTLTERTTYEEGNFI